jgi:hypothetical protein
MNVPRASLLAPLLVSIASCVSTFGTPSLKHGVVPFRNGPNVAALVVHTNCEIATAIYESMPRPGATLTDAQTARHGLWQKLYDENFVATVDFTLTATNTEGFDPSVSWVTPLTSQGHFISAVPSTAANGGSTTGSTMATYNRTLAVGIQANGSQDRNFDLTYVIDLHRLYEAVQQEVKDQETAANKHLTYRYVPLSEICTEPGTASATSLDGDLDLPETIDFGLQGLNKGRKFEYGAEGPVPRPTARANAAKKENKEARIGAAAPAQPSPESPAEVEAQEFNPNAVVGGAGAAPPKTAMGPQATNTTFSSKMDFTIIQGANGGPSWQLLKW